MAKFFVTKADIHSDIVDITGNDVNHIKNVLRYRCGDEILLSDGDGTDYLVKIAGFEQDYIRTLIVERRKGNTEPSVDVTLFQGIPKSDKMDLIIQKCVELGIGRIIPMITGRTVVRLDSEKDLENKTARWQKQSLEASKQCNRGIIPQIYRPVKFENALEITKQADLSIIPYEGENDGSLKSCLRAGRPEKIALMIGPEGGFTEEEIEKSRSNGIVPVTLGPRILRTETAAIAVLSIVMYELGDIGI